MKSLAKKSLTALVALIGAGAAATAAPLISIGDSVDVFFNGSTNVQYRSNLFYADGVQVANTGPGGGFLVNRPKESAFVFYISPGVEVNIGRNSNANVTIYYRQDFLFFSKFSDQLDGTLANVYVDGSYDWGNLQTSAGFSFVQEQQNTPTTSGGAFVAALVETDNYNAYVDANYDISPKAWVSGGFNWSRTDYTNNDTFFDRFSNTDIYTAPISFYWRLTPKLGIGPSFRYRYTQPGDNGGFNFGGGTTPLVSPSDYSDYFFNIAVDGEVLPKLSIGLNAGYQLRSPEGDRTVTTGGVPTTISQDDRNQFSVLFDAEYEVTPKLIAFVNFGHDFGVGAQGQTTTNLGGDIGALYQINSYLSANAEFGMEQSDFQDTAGREDLTTTVGTALTYSPDVYWQFSLGYYYINNDSNNNIGTNTGANFQAHTVNLQATLRY